MTIYECPINGTATAQRINDQPEWLHADPEIHVSDELLEDAQDVKWISQRYSIDEPCPHGQFVHHARLRGQA